MRIQTHSPHTGFLEKIAVEDVAYIQLPPGTTYVIRTENGKEEMYTAESWNLTIVVK